MITTNKDLRKIVRELARQGFDVAATKRGHLQVTKNGQVIATMPGTPSDPRAWRNALAPVKRAGFAWPPRR
ncbi:type II toxin-antitoxin system HicA family toxin [Nocardia transvalensis]|uniref:type II toxin-antitoxin system HicA family toxin n=1 Tax=Nocardia transvalensis TaxID=37333 RepID=UPI001892EA3B|nr:type II toxin-antitoxin system HicA family toxin [Nocardia transvalensis]MBF6332465.1 type II toxin-antitoxin system HicA family toxin [Nocardia transvalensis]